MMKGKKKRLLAGTLALLLSCSTLLNTGITALASEQSEEHAQIQEGLTITRRMPSSSR